MTSGVTAWFRGLASSELQKCLLLISGKINFCHFDCDFPPKKPFCCGFGVVSFSGSISVIS